MNNNSLTTQATLTRKPAPEIQATRAPAGYRLAPASDRRRVHRSDGDDTPSRETIELDVPAVVAALSQRLHTAGVPVTPERAVNLAQALTLVSPVSRRQLYYTARAVFVSSLAHLPAFDRVFVSIFGSQLDADDGPNDAGAVEGGATPRMSAVR